jgi:hypothetical protein
VRGVEHRWTECAVPLNACVIRFWNKKKKCTDHIVLVTTDLKLNAPWIVRHYEERPEIEQDYEQMKSGGWQLQKLSSTRYSEIVFYVLTVVLSYSLYHRRFSRSKIDSHFSPSASPFLGDADACCEVIFHPISPKATPLLRGHRRIIASRGLAELPGRHV